MGKLKIQVNNTTGKVKVTLPDGTYTVISIQQFKIFDLIKHHLI